MKGTLHWVSAEHAVPCEVRLFERLYSQPVPGKETGNHLDDLNSESIEVIHEAFIEPNWKTEGQVTWPDGCERVQFERIGYFCLDDESSDQNPIWNRTVTLKDSWSKK